MLLLDVVGFLTIATSLIQATGRVQISTPVCTSNLCRQVASLIETCMDDTVDPCVDFYTYACNRWNRSSAPAHAVLELTISKQLKELFGNGNYTNPTEKKAKDIYNQCLNETHELPFDDRTIVRAVDDLLGGWSLLKDNPNVSDFPLDEALVRLQQNDIRTFSDLSVLADDLSSDKSILFFNMPVRLSQRWELKTLSSVTLLTNPINATTQLMNKWTPIVKRLLKATNASAQWSSVEKRFEEAVNLDVMLAMVRATRPFGPTDYLKRLTFGDLSRPPFRSRFLANFLPLFNAMLGASAVKFQATNATQFGAPQLEYLYKLDQRMAQLELDEDAGLVILGDWLWWIALYHYHLVYRGTGNCIRLVKAAMPLAVSGMFSKTYITSEAVQKAEELTSEIYNGVCDAVILETTWMDRETQEAAIDKLNHTLRNIGYPEEFLHNWTVIEDLYSKVQAGVSFFDTLRTIDQSNSWINLRKLSRTNARNDPFSPTDLTAIFAEMVPFSNHIVIPASPLQPPMLYTNDYFAIFNYARLGFDIGHEFTHALDTGGRQFGKDGKPFNWWTNATQNSYNTRNYSLVDFYNNITIKSGIVDGRQTLIENTADNGGYRAAHWAFKNFVRRTGYRIKLPGLEDLNEEQLFWLIGAQIWCISDPAYTDGTHAPFRYRVLGPYMNNADFGAAYNCTLGSPMNPLKKSW